MMVYSFDRCFDSCFQILFDIFIHSTEIFFTTLMNIVKVAVENDQQMAVVKLPGKKQNDG